MKTKVLFIIFYFIIINACGQGNALYHDIQKAKDSKIHFEEISLKKTSTDIQVLNNFKNKNEVLFFDDFSIESENGNAKALNLTIPLNNKDMILELIEVTEDYYDYLIETSSGQLFSPDRDIKHFRGVIRNDDNSIVALTFYKNEIMGLICNDEGNFNLVKDGHSGKHVLYNDKNLINRIHSTCETTEDNFPSYKFDILYNIQNSLNEKVEDAIDVVIDKIVFLYVETCFDIFSTLGSITRVTELITGLLFQVGTLYYLENIEVRTKTLHIENSIDSYSLTSNLDELLLAFQINRPSISEDLGILLTFRSEMGGGLAAPGFNGLCNVVRTESLAVAMIENSYLQISDFSYSVYVVTHELGHLFGSPHTHACMWNWPDMTAIDGCAGILNLVIAN